MTGVSDTGLGWFDLSIFPCRKLIIERDLETVNAEMHTLLGVEVDLSGLAARLNTVDGMRVAFDDINDRLPEIWDYCTELPYDRLRGDYLKTMNVQVKDLPIDEARLNLLRSEIICSNS